MLPRLQDARSRDRYAFTSMGRVLAAKITVETNPASVGTLSMTHGRTLGTPPERPHPAIHPFRRCRVGEFPSIVGHDGAPGGPANGRPRRGSMSGPAPGSLSPWSP